MTESREDRSMARSGMERGLVLFLVLLFIFPWDYVTARPQAPGDSTIYLNAEIAVPVDSVASATGPVTEGADSIAAGSGAGDSTQNVPPDFFGLEEKVAFNPSPQRAVWLSALCPGLGQIYNRRYWKLPIVVGGFMGLGYATSWNNNQYRDYMQAYRDILDNDPQTNSYMNFFPPNVNEADLDKDWVQRTLKSRKDSYRRNRDLCVICLVALYLLCMVDAYVDASMAHFDISPNLSLDMTPALLNQPTPGGASPALGLNWALTF